MNRAYFFKRVRESLFSGRLSATQTDGMTRILDYRESHWPNMPDAELAYLLATVKWETAHTMQPVRETFAKSDAQAISRLTKAWKSGKLRGVSRDYWSGGYFGRGLVQITHKSNYEAFGIGDNPSAALEWPKALEIIFSGMVYGKFTGGKHKLSDYIRGDKIDYIGARRIINGTDKARQIALIAEGFHEALKQARETGDVPADEPQETGKPITRSTTAGAAAAAGVAGAATPAIETVKQVQEGAEAGKGIWDIAVDIGPEATMAIVIVALVAYIIWERRRKSKEKGI